MNPRDEPADNPIAFPSLNTANASGEIMSREQLHRVQKFIIVFQLELGCALLRQAQLGAAILYTDDQTSFGIDLYRAIG